jgi:integrase
MDKVTVSRTTAGTFLAAAFMIVASAPAILNRADCDELVPDVSPETYRRILGYDPFETLRPENGAGKAKWELDKDLKLDPWTIHDLRRTFATIHASIGTPIHITERTGIVSVYQRHEYLPEMRKAVDAFETHLASILRS